MTQVECPESSGVVSIDEKDPSVVHAEISVSLNEKEYEKYIEKRILGVLGLLGDRNTTHGIGASQEAKQIINRLKRVEAARLATWKRHRGLL